MGGADTNTCAQVRTHTHAFTRASRVKAHTRSSTFTPVAESATPSRRNSCLLQVHYEATTGAAGSMRNHIHCVFHPSRPSLRTPPRHPTPRHHTPPLPTQRALIPSTHTRMRMQQAATTANNACNGPRRAHVQTASRGPQSARPPACSPALPTTHTPRAYAPPISRCCA